MAQYCRYCANMFSGDSNYCGIKLRTFTDTHTGVQYMYYYYSHSGGITVLVDADGKPLIMEEYNAD